MKKLIQKLLLTVFSVATSFTATARDFTTTGEWTFSNLPGHEKDAASICSHDQDATALWQPKLRSVNPVRLSLFLVTHQGNDTNALVEVFASGKTNRVRVNMEAGKPRWLSVGKFLFAGRGSQAITRQGFALILKLGLTHGAYKHLPIDDHYMAHFLAPLRSPGGIVATLRIARTFRKDLQALEPLLPRVQAPTLLIWGRHDRLVPRHIIRHVERRVPQARLLVYAASGHCPQEEEPSRFVADVGDFLREAP